MEELDVVGRGADRGRAPLMPASYWLLVVVMAALHALPWAVARFELPPHGMTRLPVVGYNDTDFTQYASFVREYADDWMALTVRNPYMVGNGNGRFVLLFHKAVGLVARALGLGPYEALELSRIPALVLFFFVLHRSALALEFGFRRRVFLGGAVALLGGVDAMACLVSRVGPFFPWRDVLTENLHLTLGWSGFAAFHNPLWVTGLALTLLVVTPVLAKDGIGNVSTAVLTAMALVCAWLVHPYSAMAAGMAALCIFGCRCLWTSVPSRRTQVLTAVTFSVAAVAVIGLVLWQRQDPSYLVASRAFFGSRAIAPFWYPVGMGLLGVLALLGCRREKSSRNWRIPGLVGWIVGLSLLHSSPVFNGYHFVFQLFLPICLAASFVVAEESGKPGLSRRATTLVFMSGLVFTVLPTVMLAERDVRTRNRLTTGEVECLAALGPLEPGIVLAPERLSLVVPALTRHRCCWGHWFLGGDRERIGRLFATLSRDGVVPGGLDSDPLGSQVRYVVLQHTDVGLSVAKGWRSLAEGDGWRILERIKGTGATG
jgi:hypothetical protein